MNMSVCACACVCSISREPGEESKADGEAAVAAGELSGHLRLPQRPTRHVPQQDGDIL